MIDTNRRDFLKYTGLGSASFVVGLSLPTMAAKRKPNSADQFKNHYFAIGQNEDEFVFVMDKAEMGQGVITGQLTLFCEELDLDPQRVKVIPAPVHSVYGTMAGLQLTGGSTSTPDRWEVLRQAGAKIRHGMMQAAAASIGTSVSNLKVSNGEIHTLDGTQVRTYNDLAAEVKVFDRDVPLKEPKDFKYIGKSTYKADAIEKSTGTSEFGIDFHMEGMLTAVILRCPTFGGKAKSVKKSAALDVPGIKDVIQISSGVAIVGEKYWQVLKARKLVSVEWDKGKNANLSSESIQNQYDNKLKNDRGFKVHKDGDAKGVLADAKGADLVEAVYEAPYIAHATMEPMNAAALVKPDRVDVWTGTQGPTSVRAEVADFVGLPRENVHVHNMKYLGGGFGRRSTVDYPLEAVELSKALGGELVKVIWSREDDTQFSPMRPISRHHMKAALKDNRPVAWEHRIGCESLLQDFAPSIIPHVLPEWVPGSARRAVSGIAGWVMGAVDLHGLTGEGAKPEYDIPNVFVGATSLGLDIPVHFWRSVGNSYNGFVKESFMDELAYAAGKDPLEFRRENLGTDKRLLAVIEKVADMSKWGEPLPEGRFRGVAAHFSFGSYVAEVAEIQMSGSSFNVEKVYCAVDCGIAVNPDVVVDQMKSGIIYGLTAALYGKLDLVEGGIRQSNFHDYQMVRMSECPDIEVAIMESKESPMGVGEPGLPPIAAAVANALFAATGTRHRKLPLKA